MNAALPNSRRTALKAAVALFWIGVTGLVLFVAWRRLHRPSGQDVNKLAWEATFTERGLRVPPDGPRDGYWGQRLRKPVPDPDLGWREAEAHLPGKAESDARGIQRAGSDRPEARQVLIVGASVAWGAYASSLDTVYFKLLADGLEKELGPVRVTVLAAGAWDSEIELRALRFRGAELAPDVVVFLSGLNDLTGSATRRRRRIGLPEIPAEERAARFVANLDEARKLALERGVPILICLQPFILQKRRKTEIEERLLELTWNESLSAASLERSHAEMRRGLLKVCAAEGASCADLSELFDDQRETTFTDAFHFTDPGHRILANALQARIKSLLAARRDSRP